MGITITGIDKFKAQDLANLLEVSIDDMLTDGADEELVELVEDIQSALRKVRD